MSVTKYTKISHIDNVLRISSNALAVHDLCSLTGYIFG
jgi:hypothetical protein